MSQTTVSLLIAKFDLAGPGSLNSSYSDHAQQEKCHPAGFRLRGPTMLHNLDCQKAGRTMLRSLNETPPSIIYLLSLFTPYHLSRTLLEAAH
jgi:hypothetical protein